jgi:hypothetical protein
VIKHDGRPRSFHESGDRGMGCTLHEAEASRSKNMAKSLTRQTFGVPSQGVLSLSKHQTRLRGFRKPDTLMKQSCERKEFCKKTT